MLADVRLAAIDARAHLVVDAADGGKAVVDLARHGLPDDPMEAIARWAELSAWADDAKPAPDGPLDEARLTCPVPRPTQVFAIGVNYADHAAEMRGGPPPSDPLTFTKFPSCLAGPRDDIRLVPGSVDWEVELVLVVGAAAPGSVGAALGAGCCIGQDVSERQRQMAGTPPQFSLGKSFPGFGPLGPWVSDEVDPTDLAISCALNGEVVQAARTSQMVHGPAKLLEFLAGICELRPGDVIFTGTPSGVGAGRTPPRFLQPGDVVVSSIEHLGTLVNRCR